MKKLFCPYLLIALLLILPRRAHTEENGISIIPKPQYLEFQSEAFQFESNVFVKSHLDDPFYKRLIVDKVRNVSGINLNDNTNGEKGIVLKIVNQQELRSIASENSWILPFNLGNEGYILHVDHDRIRILAHQKSGIFYGIQSVLQLLKEIDQDLKLPGILIIDKPDMSFRGWQDDISRGPIPSMDFLKRQIREMSSFKLNRFTLYTEHVFKSQKHPTIAPPDGITAKEIRELSIYARRYHVDLIANYQSFGHMTYTLDKMPYRELAETPHLISPAFEETYQFLEDMIREISESYGGDFFHLNCDETFGLGEGPAKQMLDSMSTSELYAYHINRLSQVVKQSNLKPIIWSDVLEEHPELFDLIDKDLILMPWDYDARNTFDDKLDHYRQRQFPFIVAPAVTCWDRIIPDYETSFENMYAFIRDGYKAGADGVLITSWDDGGLNFFYPNIYGFAWGGNIAWNVPEENEEKAEGMQGSIDEFNKIYNTLYFNGEDAVTLLNEISRLHQSQWPEIARLSTFEEPIFPLFPIEDPQAASVKLNNVRNRLTKVSEHLKDIASRHSTNNMHLEYMTFSLQKSFFALEKSLFKILLRDYLKNKGANERAINDMRDELLKSLKGLKSEYLNLWNKENRKWWLDRNLAKFDLLEEELENLGSFCFIQPIEYAGKEKMNVHLSTIFGNPTIYYTLDGSIPDLQSSTFTEVLTMPPGTINARAIAGERSYPITIDSFIVHKAIGKLYQLRSSFTFEDPQLTAGGEDALVDGRRGSNDDFLDGRWQGFSQRDLDIVIDMGTLTKIKRISIGFLQKSIKRVIFPEYVEYYKSDDGIDYTLFGRQTHNYSPLINAYITKDFELSKKIKTRYIRIAAKSMGVLPEGHRKKGRAALLLADEVMVY